jgi:hypothetical protein
MHLYKKMLPQWSQRDIHKKNDVSSRCGCYLMIFECFSFYQFVLKLYDQMWIQVNIKERACMNHETATFIEKYIYSI